MDIISEAMKFAIDAHNGARRKGDGSPAILHSMEAAAIVSTLTREDKTIAAAVLHDVVEDTPKTLFEIREKFGDRVAYLVGAETEDKMLDIPSEDSWKVRKLATIRDMRTCTDYEVLCILLGDKLSNMRSFYKLRQEKGQDMWKPFNQSNPSEHHWYYRTIADILKERFWDIYAWQEYDNLIQRVFPEIESRRCYD